VKPFILALQFFTIVTLRSDLNAEPGDLAKSRAWWGVVGTLLGLALAAVAWALGHLLPPLALAGPLVLAWAAFTRFLHLDGVADTADALVYPAPRERSLAIMKDTRIGAFGVAALAGVLLIKFAMLASLPLERLWPALIAAPALARALAASLSVLLPPATPDKGLGAATALGSAGVAVMLASVATALAVAGLACGLGGLLAALPVLVLGLLLGRWFLRRLGGVTGDCLGASIELAECLVLASLTAY
jgi:adenosylcobinamide-GDP ribazoletransferase